MIIITQKCGRLGNRLLLLSHLIAYGLEKRNKVIDLCFDEYSSYFTSTSFNPYITQFPPCKNLINNLSILNKLPIDWNYLRRKVNGRLKPVEQWLEREPNRKKYWQILSHNTPDALIIDDLEVKMLIIVNGWYVRAPKCLQKHADTIRAWFTPVPKYQVNIENLLHKIREDTDTLVGLHIRAGDYRIHGGFYPLDVWKSIMERMTILLPQRRISFLICSDEDFRAQKSYFEEYNVFFGTGNIIEDLYSLARCDYLIAPPSTYSNWAAFYGQVPLFHLTGSHEIKSLAEFQKVNYYLDHRIAS